MGGGCGKRAWQRVAKVTDWAIHIWDGFFYKSNESGQK